MKLNAKQLRDLDEEDGVPDINRQPVYFILDNVYDTYNVGGLFRLADALGAQKIYLCGTTETPPNHRINKASIGTYKVVPWEYKATPVEAIRQLQEAQLTDRTRSDRISIVAIEQHETSIPYTKFPFTLPVAFVIGNETEGVSEPALKESDTIVELPMYGVNKSLNVIVATAIVAYHALAGS